MSKLSKSTFISSIFLLVLVGLPFAKKIGADNWLKYVDEITLLLLSPIAIRGITELIKHKPFLLFIIGWLCYIFISFIGALIQDIPPVQTIYQFAIEAKIILVLLILLGLKDTRKVAIKTIEHGKYFIILSAIMVIWQFTDPSTYYHVFPNDLDNGVLELPGGTSTPRGSGVFSHPSELASFSAFMFIYFFYANIITQRNRYIWLTLSAFMLISSLSRLEIFAVILTISFGYLYIRHGAKKYFLLIILISATTALLPVLHPYVELVVERLGLRDLDNTNSARTIFYMKSFELANIFFPIGYGLGGFGGESAKLFNSSVYSDLGFSEYWWYLHGKYMTDTFWPHVLGESGYLGLLFYTTAFFLLFIQAINGAKKTNCKYNKLLYFVGLSSYIFVLINSLASANITTARTEIIMFIFIVAAFKNSSTRKFIREFIQ